MNTNELHMTALAVHAENPRQNPAKPFLLCMLLAAFIMPPSGMLIFPILYLGKSFADLATYSFVLITSYG